ncbi:MAG: ArsA family ATPase [Syntrophobacterales bacterium]|nr:MAG: ArsA family ATPase [Syntrophobacterales bacterium]
MIRGKKTRVILFAGKGGVGKTSIAAATGISSARIGYKTLVMSLDVAHSLSDIYDLNKGLMDKNKGEPIEVDQNLWIQEIDVQEEIQRNWKEVYQYIATLFNISGIDEVLAEELAIMPGMEEVSSLLYINRFVNEKVFDVVILDCAPTGESLRFISIPTTLEWYMKKVFKVERLFTKYARPVVQRIYSVPLPDDDYFESLRYLFERLQGVESLLTNPRITSVRLVTNPEKIVIKETQRAFMYFCLYGLCVDAIIINRILPEGISDVHFDGWKGTQSRYIDLVEEYFSPVPIFKVGLFSNEIVGGEDLAQLSKMIYDNLDPATRFSTENPHKFTKINGQYVIIVRLPFITKEDVEVSKSDDELILRIGGFKRHILLPRKVAHYNPLGAKLDGQNLVVTFGGENDEKGNQKG